MKPIPNKIKYPAALTNTEIKKITAITGFFEVITSILDTIAIKEIKSNKKKFCVNTKKKIIQNLANA